VRILIAGGTGFIGSYLSNRFILSGREVTILSRSRERIIEKFNRKVQALDWQELESDEFDLLNFDLIINLCGVGIAERNWSEARKKEIIDSRIIPAEKLSTLCAKYKEQAPAIFNASGVGIYGLDNGPKNTFMEELATLWEAQNKIAREANVRVVNMRFGAVLGAKGGMLKKLLPIYKLGLGGKIGDGKQLLPWICIEDLAGAIDFLIEHKDIEGPVDFVAPDVISQAQFAKALAKAVNRPAFLITPGFVFKLALRQLAEELLLYGQRVQPELLEGNGFIFQYQTIDKALSYLLVEPSASN